MALCLCRTGLDNLVNGLMHDARLCNDLRDVHNLGESRIYGAEKRVLCKI